MEYHIGVQKYSGTVQAKNLKEAKTKVRKLIPEAHQIKVRLIENSIDDDDLG